MFKADSIDGIRSSGCEIREVGFLTGLSCPNGIKKIFFALIKSPIFFIFKPRASFVETDNKSGLSFLRWAFAAIKTGVSVIPFASFASVFPVHGKMTSRSSRLLGPIGSASLMVRIGGKPVISSALFKKLSAVPKRLSILCAESEKMVCMTAPSFWSASSASKIRA